MTTFSIQPANQPIGLVHVKKGEEERYLLKVNSLTEYPIKQELYDELMSTLQSNAKAFKKIGEMIASKASMLIDGVG
jgi:CxxC motif-containing protein